MEARELESLGKAWSLSERVAAWRLQSPGRGWRPLAPWAVWRVVWDALGGRQKSQRSDWWCLGLEGESSPATGKRLRGA